MVEVTITWKVPVFNGVSNIIIYTFTSNYDAKTSTVNGETYKTIINIKKETDTTKYKFTIVATKFKGNSLIS